MRYFICVALVLFFNSCDHSQQTESTADTNPPDKEKIEKLVKAVYFWHESEGSKNPDFTFKGNDSMYTALDKDAIKNRIIELRSTKFFSEAFLLKYESLGNELDKDLQNGSIKYYVGETPPFSSNANPWTNTQDVPENYWEHITIDGLKINENSATFFWTWGNNFQYEMEVKKEKGDWKIYSMQGFTQENFF